MKLADLQLVKQHAPTVGSVCFEMGEDPFDVTAIVMRESRFGWAAPYWPKGTPDGWGDGSTEAEPTKGYGYGWGQIDRRFHKHFHLRADKPDPRVQLRYSCKILHDNRSWFLRNPAVRTDDLQRLRAMSIAAYNCGCGNVALSMALGLGIDGKTTGRDYSAWVIRFAEELRGLVPDLFEPRSEPVPPAPVPDAEVVS